MVLDYYLLGAGINDGAKPFLLSNILLLGIYFLFTIG
jgi:hypothetical protein